MLAAEEGKGKDAHRWLGRVYVHSHSHVGDLGCDKGDFSTLWCLGFPLDEENRRLVDREPRLELGMVMKLRQPALVKLLSRTPSKTENMTDVLLDQGRFVLCVSQEGFT